MDEINLLWLCDATKRLYALASTEGLAGGPADTFVREALPLLWLRRGETTPSDPARRNIVAVAERAPKP